MSRLSIDRMPEAPWPEVYELVNGIFVRFDTEDDARAEDAKRVRLLRKTVLKFPDLAPRANRLARKLDYADRDEEAPHTLASFAHWRDRLRLRVVPHMHRLAKNKRWGQPSVVHILPKHWEFTPAELDRVDPRKLVAAFRSDLNRVAAKLKRKRKKGRKVDGYLIAFVHGEYEPEMGVYRLHLHGLVAGGIKSAINVLRARKNYKSFRKPKSKRPQAVTQRIRVSRKPLNNLPTTLSYLCKPYWPSRRIGKVGHDGKIKRERRGRRIPEPQHTQVLLWHDRWCLRDLTVMVGVAVGKVGFEVSE